MINKQIYIWIWFQENKLFKAIYNHHEKNLSIYNENDQIIIKRKGLTVNQINKINIIFCNKGAKRIDGKKEPFTFL